MYGEFHFYDDETCQKYFKKSTGWITRIFTENVISALDRLKPASILDVGCGNGYISDIISRSLNVRVIGCDLDKNRLKTARNRFHQDVVVADISRLPFKDGSFDTVLAMEILEHVRNPDDALDELERVAKKNIVITVPNDPYFMMANFFRGKNFRSFGNPWDHIHHFNKKSLQRYLSTKFPDVEVVTNAGLWLLAVVPLV
jgi:ubiquinone/menaquinone biosynthesis C-methylase UbiE